jgi:hypothetical protein
MEDVKSSTTMQVDDTIEKSSGAGAVIGGSEALKNHEEYQHSLTKKQAFKEEWKPIAWCE